MRLQIRYLINALISTYLIWIIASIKFKVHVKSNEWYSYLTEKKDVNSDLAY